MRSFRSIILLFHTLFNMHIFHVKMFVTQTWLFLGWIALSMPDKALSSEYVFTKQTTLSNGYLFIRWIALSTLRSNWAQSQLAKQTNLFTEWCIFSVNGVIQLLNNWVLSGKIVLRKMQFTNIKCLLY